MLILLPTLFHCTYYPSFSWCIHYFQIVFFLKDFVIEALRSIAELITYGDQHNSGFFEWDFSVLIVLDLCVLLSAFYMDFTVSRLFMEKQVMGEFVRILKISRTVTVSLQLLQTISIMIQNLKSDHAICKLFVTLIKKYEIAVAFISPVGYHIVRLISVVVFTFCRLYV